MVTFRKAVVMAVILLFTIYYLYPRPPQRQRQSPLRAAGSGGSGGGGGGGGGGGAGGSGDGGGGGGGGGGSSSTATTTPTTAAPAPAEPVVQAAVGSAKMQQKLSIESVRNMPMPKQLEYHFPYDVSAKFPAYIWQTWKYTPSSSQFSEKFRVTEASWTEKHPTFVHEVITDQVALHLIKHLYSAVPDVLDAYTSMPLPILKADFFRYLILYARGGIYADIDTFALKPATEWIPQAFGLGSVGLLVGIEADPDRPDWAKWYSRRIQFCQWTIQAKPGHPVLRDIIVNITTETLARKREGRLRPQHDSVLEWTGPAVWTDAIFGYFNNPQYFDMAASQKNITFKDFTGMKESKKVGDVVVLPITSFSPGIGHQGAGTFEDPMAFVKHEFAGSWKPESERVIVPQQEKDKREKERKEAEKKQAEKKEAKKKEAEKKEAQKKAEAPK